MKWLFRFILFLSVLSTAGSSHHLHSFSKFTSGNYVYVSEVNNHLHDLKFTPVQPVRDSRVFQIVEDEEDNTSSRVKKNTPLITSICAFFYGSLPVFKTKNTVKTSFHYAHIAFNSHPRYIQLRTIKV